MTSGGYVDCCPLIGPVYWPKRVLSPCATGPASLPVCVWIVVPPAKQVLKLPAMFSRTMAAPEPPSWIS
jgi:hypothetical protein